MARFLLTGAGPGHISKGAEFPAMTYEYVCSSCHHEWEAEQSISAAPLTKCPKCRKNTAKRQISGGAGFILKGGGWYADGYGSSKGGSSKKGEDASSSSTPKSDKADKADKPDKPKKKTDSAAAA